MTNPYLFPEGNIHVAFSGGRTSAFMLRQLIEANGIDAFHSERVKVIFCNTGLEHEATLEFVRDCGEHWDIPIVWLEYDREPFVDKKGEKKTRPICVINDFETASRNGEPFETLIDFNKHLPNRTQRFCTLRLKRAIAIKYLRQHCGWKSATKALGIRADEPKRIKEYLQVNLIDMLKPRKVEFEDKWLPLVDADIGKMQVSEFWKKSNFDLDLPNINGTTIHGNYVLCFQKGIHTLTQLIQEEPERAKWYIKQERKIGKIRGEGGIATFINKTSFIDLKAIAEGKQKASKIPPDRIFSIPQACGADGGECV